MEKTKAPSGAKKPPAEFEAMRGISTRDDDFQPGDKVIGLPEDIVRLYLDRGYIRKVKVK